MNRVAIFGNAGGGKSTLARKLAEATGLPLYSIDKLKFRPGGDEVPHADYLRQHEELLGRDRWILDGFGCVPSAWQRFAAADTLIHVDLPLLTHGLWIAKRMLKGLFVNPEGWPQNSPILRSTLTSYKVLWLCHRKLTPAYRKLVAEQGGDKTVHHLRSPKEIEALLGRLRAGAPGR
ncbi:adenylate kinase [Gallaecimonas sp. GXIMD4217]|uniref:adenylate kinase n=1 Tax=Gallaecimonas sp. GXIMD4217 TaxID=3131927 RepID=UPI00311B1338